MDLVREARLRRRLHSGVGHGSVTYTDERGSFEFGYEDGLLFGPPRQVRSNPNALMDWEINSMAERVISGIRAEGHIVEIAKR